MPRQQSYHHRNTLRRSNNYYSALGNTGQYNSKLHNPDANHARNIVRLQVVHDTTQPIEVKRVESRDLRQHGQSQTQQRVAPLATFTQQAPKVTELETKCLCFKKGDLICFW